MRYLFSIILVLVLFVSVVFATDHYMASDGSASWSNSTSIETPCSWQTAETNASAGDTVYLLSGTYDMGCSSGWEVPIFNPTNSGTGDADEDRIIFKKYSGTVTVKMSSTCSALDSAGGIIGTNNKSYITYDGFFIDQTGTNSENHYVKKGLHIRESNGITVKNCTFTGTTAYADPLAPNDNAEGLRVEGSDNTKILNSYFSAYRSPIDNHNTSALKLYDNTNTTIANIEVTDCSEGLYLKRNNDGVDIYNSWIHDNFEGGLLSIYSGNTSDDIAIYNNILANNTQGNFQIEDDGNSGNRTNDLTFYNNTLFNSGYGAGSGQTGVGQGAKVYNNIFMTHSTNVYRSMYNAGYIAEFDHNCFYSMDLKINRYGSNYNLYTSLSSWQSSGKLESNYDAGCGSNQNPGCGSLLQDPEFITATGARDTIAEFELDTGSPCIGTGRSSVDMGADVSSVGINAGEAQALNNQASGSGNFR